MYSSFTFIVSSSSCVSDHKKSAHHSRSGEAPSLPWAPSAAPHVERRLAARPAGAQARDAEEPIGGVVDLEGRVVQAETFVQERLELPADPVAVLAALHEDVRGERGEAGAD